MTYQVGIGIAPGQIDSFKRVATNHAARLGYLVEYGVDSFWQELQSGLHMAKEDFDWADVALIRSAGLASSASSLNEELYSYIKNGCEPPFFNFLKAIKTECELSEGNLDVIFIDEWPDNNEARIGEGSVDDLIGYIRAFKDWEGYYHTGGKDAVQQGKHEIPLIFTLARDKGDGGS